MAAAISPSLIMRSDAPTPPDLVDDLLVPRSVEHHDDDVLDAFVERTRDDGEGFGNGRFQFQIVDPGDCMSWITRGP